MPTNVTPRWRNRFKELIVLPVDAFAPTFFSIIFCLVAILHLPLFSENEIKHVNIRGPFVIWIYSSIGVALAGLATVSVAVMYIRSGWSQVPAYIRYGTGVLLALAGAVIIPLITKNYLPEFSQRDLLGLDTQTPGVVVTLFLHDLLALTATAAVVMALTLVSWRIAEKSAEELGEALQGIRNLVYISATQLALTVFEVNRLFACAATNSAERTQIANAFTVGTGLVFTLLLFLIFGPPSYQGATQLQKLMSIAAEEKGFKRETWLLKNQLPGAPLQHLATIGSIFLPLASGLLSQSLTKLMG